MNTKTNTEQSGNKVALITGAAQRLGAKTAETLHQAGFDIALHYRSSSDKALQLQESLCAVREQSVQCFQADLNNHEETLQLAENVTRAFGRLDVLVNNASSFYPTPIKDIDELQWDDLFNSNVKGAFFLSQALIDPLSASHGCIVNIIDIHAEKPLKNYPVYSMAKAALAMMTKSLAKELGTFNIRVNGVSPGAILWPEQQTDFEQEQKSILERIALGRTGEPSDIANTVLFLVQQAPYISGQIIAVDGGRTLNC